MKKERNCNYPSMPMYQMPPMNPGMPIYNSDMNTISKMHEQVMNLEKRVARLEGMISGSNMNPTYQESNFYMV